MTGTDCRECGHPERHHEANECWTDSHGREIDNDTDRCPCWWYEPVVVKP